MECLGLMAQRPDLPPEQRLIVYFVVQPNWISLPRQHEMANVELSGILQLAFS
jgi:hypothetical protein